MTRAEVAQLEDTASAAMAIRGDWERAYRRRKTQYHWRELTIADQHAQRAMDRLTRARAELARQERIERAVARASAQAVREALAPRFI